MTPVLVLGYKGERGGSYSITSKMRSSPEACPAIGFAGGLAGGRAGAFIGES
ncbi:MAG: hypothetical protein LBD96_08200 [Treponema sp.]|jgi:hypothetical protein|nr:hypothetical protein [Treponema sp.]